MKLHQFKIVIRGAGDLASGIACRLSRSNLKKICMTDVAQPQAVRREVSFCEAIYDGEKTVEGITARRVDSFDLVQGIWDSGEIPVAIDPDAMAIGLLKPDIVVDAILAKKNLGTRMADAALVIGIGPGFCAGKDVHMVVETFRGHNLGRVLYEGEAEKDTGTPGLISGYGIERVLRGPGDGLLSTQKEIGDHVEKGDPVATVGGVQIKTPIKGIVRGLLRDKSRVWEGMKIGDIDARGIRESCFSVSDKALAIAGGVLEAILSHFNH